MSDSIHTTRQVYKKARTADYGTEEARTSALVPLWDDLHQKRLFKKMRTEEENRSKQEPRFMSHRIWRIRHAYRQGYVSLAEWVK